MDNLPLYINGEFVAPLSAGTLDVIDPSTTEVIGRVPDANAADVAPDPLDKFFGRGYDPDSIAPLPALAVRRRSLDGSDTVAELVLPCVDSARAELAALFGGP